MHDKDQSIVEDEQTSDPAIAAPSDIAEAETKAAPGEQSELVVDAVAVELEKNIDAMVETLIEAATKAVDHGRPKVELPKEGEEAKPTPAPEVLVVLMYPGEPFVRLKGRVSNPDAAFHILLIAIQSAYNNRLGALVNLCNGLQNQMMNMVQQVMPKNRQERRHPPKYEKRYDV